MSPASSARYALRHSAFDPRIRAAAFVAWLDTANHIDLYDNPAFVEPAIAWLAGWLTARLPAGARRPAV